MKKSKRFYSESIKFKPALLVAIFLIGSLTGCKKQVDSSSPPPPPLDKPNIILILADDLGYEIPTCNGGQSYETSNLDQMAGAGLRFTEAHATPLCSPSRFMILTGKYNFRNYTKWGVMDPGEKTIANMLHDAGYATCVAGKWQLDGGDQSIRAFGFDNYSVWDPFGHERGSRYKDPDIYENGAYLSASETKDKYADDIFTDHILNFIEDNTKQRKYFFVYYPLCLVHRPFSPTPDDPEFAGWNPNNSDPKFFPSMVKYMDKKIGQIIQKVKDLGIEKNTIILFVGDNGTSQGIISQFNGTEVEGGKGITTEAGTHVPLLAYAPGLISNATNNDLIDFTDFLPTLAGIANTPTPVTYGVLDGVSFYPRLVGEAGTPRDWIFCHFDPNPDNSNADTVERFVQNINYKYYEDDRFYDIIADIFEKNPVPDVLLTPEEKQVKLEFKDVLSTMH